MATKQKSKAYIKAETIRNLYNKGYQKIEAKNLSCTVFIYELNGAPIAKGYIGKSNKPRFHARFQTTEKRAKYVSEFMTNIINNSDSKKPTKQTRLLEVGDILYSSWGYEQTNIDYYLVTELVGKTQVIIREIGKQSADTEFMQGKCIPDPSNIIGEPMKKRAQDTMVKISDCQRAYKKEFQIIAGAKVYSADHWSSYH